MEKLNVGQILVHKGSEQEGRVTQVWRDGEIGQFRTKSGALFTVEAGELVDGGWEPDEFEKLELMLMTAPKHEVSLVWKTGRLG